MQKVEMSVELFNKLAKYLSTCPYATVANLMAEINKDVKLVQEPEKTVEPLKVVEPLKE